MSSSSRKAIFFILLIGLAYVAYAYMIKPANQNLANKKEQVEQKRGKLRELDQATAAAVDLARQLEELEEAINFFESKLPPTEEIDQVLQDRFSAQRRYCYRAETRFGIEKDSNDQTGKQQRLYRTAPGDGAGWELQLLLQFSAGAGKA